MSYPLGGLLVPRNKVEGNRAINIFGRNDAVPTSMAPLTPGGFIQRQLIEQQGQVELRTQRIEIEQQQQGKDLDQILLLLKQLQGAGQ